MKRSSGGGATAAGPIRVELAHRDRELLLPPGRYQIGRSSECQIRLDDAAASRHHAELVVDVVSAVLRDLGSSNGLFVNGERIGTVAHDLVDGDTIVIGSEKLTVRIRSDSNSDMRRVATPAMPPPTAPTRGDSEHLPQELTERLDAVAALCEVVEHSLVTNRIQYAEQVFERPFQELLQLARSGGPFRASAIEPMVKSAVRLARASKKHHWFDSAIELLSVARAPIPLEIFAELSTVLDAVRDVDIGLLERYASALGELPAGPQRERSVRRVTELARIARARRGA